MTESKKNKFNYRWLAVGSLPIIAILWFIVSIVFRLIALSQGSPELSQVGNEIAQQELFYRVLRGAINWTLGILALIAIPLTILGVVMIASKKETLIRKSLSFGWKWANKKRGTWASFIIIGFAVLIGFSFVGEQFVEYQESPQFAVDLVQEDEAPQNIDVDTIAQELGSEFVSQPANEAVSTGFVDSFMYGFQQGFNESAGTIKPGYAGHYIAFQIISQILSMLFRIMVLGGAISVVYKQSLGFKGFFESITFMTLLKYIGGAIVFGVAVLGGFLLFIVPGIIIAVRASYWTIAILKDGLGPIAAFKHSRKITKGHFWDIVGLRFVSGLIQIPGVLLLGIGLFWTLPTSWVADVKMYQLLAGGDDEDDSNETTA